MSNSHPERMVATIPQQPGMWRSRLLDRMGMAKIAMVFGPAGAGKSTLLAQHAIQFPNPRWVELSHSDGFSSNFIAKITHATGGLIRWTDGSWKASSDAPLTLVVDDAHHLAGNETTRLLAQLSRSIPISWRLSIASRSSEGLDLELLQTSGDSLTLTWDDLRFRLWEIEQLFASHYNLPLSAEELPPLARNSGGWITALHLFQIAARKEPKRRSELIRGIRSQSLLLRRYLTEQVLGGLDSTELYLLAQIASFELIRSDLVAHLVGNRGTALVDRLHQLGLLTATAVPGEFQLHGLLRDQLLEQLVADSGRGGLLEIYRTTANVLEINGYAGEAARAYLRSGRVDDAERLEGAGFSALRKGDLELSVADDQWILWAEGVANLRRGSGSAALSLLEKAISLFDTPPLELVRLTGDLAAWLRPPCVPEPARPFGALRRWLAGGDDMAVVLLNDRGLAGALYRAIEETSATQKPATVIYDGRDRLLRILAALAQPLIELLAGGRIEPHSLHEVELLLQTGVSCSALERIYLGLSADLTTDDVDPAHDIMTHLQTAARAEDDDLGALLLEVIESRRRGTGDLSTLLDDAGLARLNNLVLGPPSDLPIEPTTTAVDEFYIRLTGPFRIGSLAELNHDQPLRPQHLAILKALALHSAQWIPRSQLLGWFWPEVDADTGVRRLATALSAIRKALEQHAAEAVLRRSGDSYCLDIEAGRSDVAALVARLSTVEVVSRYDIIAAAQTVDHCLSIQQGPLLAGVHLGVWVDEAQWELDHRWDRALRALFEGTDPDAAPRMILDLLPRLLGTAIYSDYVWNTAIEVARRSDAPLLAKQLQERYDRLLGE